MRGALRGAPGRWSRTWSRPSGSRVGTTSASSSPNCGASARPSASTVTYISEAPDPDHETAVSNLARLRLYASDHAEALVLARRHIKGQCVHGETGIAPHGGADDRRRKHLNGAKQALRTLLCASLHPKHPTKRPLNRPELTVTEYRPRGGIDMGFPRIPTLELRAYARPMALREGADDGTDIANADPLITLLTLMALSPSSRRPQYHTKLQ